MKRLMPSPISVTFLLLSASAYPQPPEVLKATKVIPVPSAQVGAMYTPVHCSLDGRIYYRNYDSGQPNSGVTGVSADGSAVVHYQLPGSDNYKRATLSDFAVTQRGGVVLLAQSQADLHAVEFDQAGKVLREVEIPDAGWVARYAMSGPDTVTASGIDRPEPQADSGQVLGTPTMKLLNLRSGSVTTGMKPVGNIQDTAVRKADIHEAMNGLTSGEIEPGVEGETYILSKDSGMRLTRIAKGAANITATIPSPFENAAPLQLLVAKDRVGIIFEKETEPVSTTYIQMLDATSLKPLQTYTVDGLSAGWPSCMTDSAITFTGNNQGHLMIREASLPAK